MKSTFSSLPRSSRLTVSIEAVYELVTFNVKTLFLFFQIFSSGNTGRRRSHHYEPDAGHSNPAGPGESNRRNATANVKIQWGRYRGQSTAERRKRINRRLWNAVVLQCNELHIIFVQNRPVDGCSGGERGWLWYDINGVRNNNVLIDDDNNNDYYCDYH